MSRRIHLCKHDRCEFVSSTSSEAIRASYVHSSSLTKHHAVLDWHTCCQGETKCEVGKLIAENSDRKMQLQYLQRKRKCSSDEAGGSFKCQHESACNRVFDNQVQESNHRRTKHQCPESCKFCQKTKKKANAPIGNKQGMDESPEIEKYLTTHFPQKKFAKINSSGLKDSAILIQEVNGTIEYMPAKKALEIYSQNLLGLCENIHQVNHENFQSMIEFLKERKSLMTDIVPCLLHIAIGIVKLLRKLLLEVLRSHTPAVVAFAKSLAHPDVNINMYEANAKQVATPLMERLEKIRFSFAHSLSLLKHHEIILECTKLLPAAYKTKGENVGKAWRQALCLLAVASNPNPDSPIKAEEWKKCASKFVETVLSVSDTIEITSYLHCFSYHVGSYLEKYSVKSFGDCSTEENIKCLKESLSNYSHSEGTKGVPDAFYAQWIFLQYRCHDATSKKSLPMGSNHHWSTLPASTLQSALFDNQSAAIVPETNQNLALSNAKGNSAAPTTSPLATSVTPKQLPAQSSQSTPIFRKLVPFSFSTQIGASTGNQLPPTAFHLPFTGSFKTNLLQNTDSSCSNKKKQ